MEFQPGLITGATIFAVLGWVATIGMFLYKRGGSETELKVTVANAQKKLEAIADDWKKEQTAFDQHVRELETNRQKWRDDMERSVDQRLGGVIGAHNLLRDQVQELRENVARNYMTKPEIAAIEERVTSNQGRIIDRLEKLDSRMGSMHDAVLAALNKNRT